MIPKPGRCPSSRGLVLTGTIFYRRYEDWSHHPGSLLLGRTLTTVGYGNLTPTSDVTRIFTIIYILTRLGVLVALLSSLAQQYIKQKSEGGTTRDPLSGIRRRNRPSDKGGSQ